jgi:altronate dehydratase small subunit
MSEAVIVVDEKDNVATALRTIEEGESLRIDAGGAVIDITVLEPIAFGHKIALADLQKGSHIVKYGEVMGLATKDIAKGEHTHVHNVEGPEPGREEG